MFIDKLIERIRELSNPSVVGLDPRLEFIPDHIKETTFKEFGEGLEGAANAILCFNKKIIDAVYDVVPAIKPQLAYYEMYGLEGIKAFYGTIEYAKAKGMLVIADGKRNDIGSTAEAYSSAYLGTTPVNGKDIPAFDTDALTVNPYLGYDGIKPFINDCSKFGKGIFVLVKTSNKSSGQLQDLFTQQGKSIYEIVAQYVDDWGKTDVGKYGYSSIGAVVGATYPNQAKILRGIMKKAYILVPGYGAQGGTAKDVLHCFNSDGLGAIVNASRSIMCAWQAEKWADKYSGAQFDLAIRAEALSMRDDINEVLDGRAKG
jgi:orotidine 5''-phosphate decarboxylase, subfamily 2